MGMTREDVRQRVEQLVVAMREEQELRDRLTVLDFVGARESDVETAYRKQQELIKAIDALRYEKVMPIVREMSEFVALSQRSAAAPPPAITTKKAPSAVSPAKRPQAATTTTKKAHPAAKPHASAARRKIKT